jgi:hypothetical protein
MQYKHSENSSTAASFYKYKVVNKDVYNISVLLLNPLKKHAVISTKF